MSKTKIIFFASNPQNTTTLNLGEEARSIDKKIREAEFRDSLEFVTSWAVRPTDLLGELNIHRPTIVHFSGHGAGEDGLILTDNSGESKSVSTEALKGLFSVVKDNIRLVVLNACFSEVQGRAISEVIDCVVGMSRNIGDIAAISFAASFYSALGYGRSVKEAFEQGRVALMLEGIPEENTPVLLVRKGIDVGSVCLIQEEPPVKAPDDITAVKTGIGLLKELIGKETVVADAVCLSKKEIEITYRQIDRLELFKTIHDALHTIEFECLVPMQASGPASPLLSFMMRFGSEKITIEKAIQKREMNDLVYRLQLDRLNQVDDAFVKAVDAPSKDAYKELISELNTLLSGAPPEIDRCISDAATQLNLDDLVELMTKVRDKLPASAAGRDVQLELFLKSIEALNRLRQELKRRVSEHGYLQDLDKELRTVCVQKIVPGATEWKRIKALRTRLGDPFSEELKKENKFLDVAEKKTEEARDRGDERATRNNLKIYFSAVSSVFRDVDRSLKEFCMRLSGEVNQPLQIILSMC